MPPCLLSNLLKVLRYSSGNIQNIGISSGCLADMEAEVMSQPHLHTSKHEALCWPVWRIQFQSNFPPVISQCSYQITSQMRWHPLATDKTFLQ